MTKTPPRIPSDSLDPAALLAELLRVQEERDRVRAEKDLLKERLLLATRPASPATTEAPAPTGAAVAGPLPDRLGRLAEQLIAVSREMRQFRADPVAPATPDPVMVAEQQRRLGEATRELEDARLQIEALETQLRYLEISNREKGQASAGDGDLGRQLSAALEREDQLLIRLHQLETTLSHRQADQLTLLERDKQIQQLKFFLHQGALDFEKLQTRHRAVEAESLEQKHRIIDLQTQLERNQASARGTARRLQDQVAALTKQVGDSERKLGAAETRQENLEDEVERLSAQIFQMEERLVAGAGQLELMRFEAGRVPALELRIGELEAGRSALEDENAGLRGQVAELTEALELLEENAGALDARVGEDAAALEALHSRLADTAAQEAATAERDALAAERDALVAERDALAAERDALFAELERRAAENERKLVAAMELVDRKEEGVKAHEARVRELTEQHAAARGRAAELERQFAEAVNTARDRERGLKDELAQAVARNNAGGEKAASELALRNERIAELENGLATQRIEVQRLAAQLKSAEMKSTEAAHWADKLKGELAQVRAQLDDEIRQRAGSEDKVRQMEHQLPEIRRLFDELERQVDGFEDSLALEEDRTARLGDSLDSLVASIGDVFRRITDQLHRLESERGLLAGRLEEAERARGELAAGGDHEQAERNRQTIHDLNVQLGILEGNLLTMQVKLHNQLAPSVEKILRVTGDLELLGMLNAATELRAVAGTLSGLMQ